MPSWSMVCPKYVICGAKKVHLCSANFSPAAVYALRVLSRFWRPLLWTTPSSMKLNASVGGYVLEDLVD